MAAKYNYAAVKGEGRNKIDMSSDISRLVPSATPLTAILRQIAKEDASSVEFSWLERDTAQRSDVLTGAVTNVATVLPVTNGSYFVTGMQIRNARTGETMYVDSVAGNNVTVRRAFGTVAAAAMNNGDTILILANASGEGSGAPVDSAVPVVKKSNFTQIVKTAVSVTNTANAVAVYGSDKVITAEQKDAATQHNLDLEKVMIFGQAKEDTSGADVIRTTGGILSFLNDNIYTSADGNLSQEQFNQFLEGVFMYGNTTKTLFCSPRMLSVINQFAVNKLQTVSGAKEKYGIEVVSYICAHGTLNLVKTASLIGSDVSGIILDMEKVKYKPLKGRDTSLTTNVQANDADIRRDLWLTEFGVEVKNSKYHGVLKNINKAV